MMRDIISGIFNDLLAVSIEAKVITVNKEDNNCDVLPLNGGSELFDVMLCADDGKNAGYIIYPSVGSVVIVSPVENSGSQYYVSLFSEIDELISTVAKSKLSITDKGVSISRENDDLKSVLVEMADQMLKIYAVKDNAGILKLRNRINNLLNGI